MAHSLRGKGGRAKGSAVLAETSKATLGAYHRSHKSPRSTLIFPRTTSPRPRHLAGRARTRSLHVLARLGSRRRKPQRQTYSSCRYRSRGLSPPCRKSGASPPRAFQAAAHCWQKVKMGDAKSGWLGGCVPRRRKEGGQSSLCGSGRD